MVGLDESMSITRNGFSGEEDAVVGIGVKVLSRIDIMNSSGVPPESTFVVISRTKLSVLPLAKDCTNVLKGVASVITTEDDKSPPALPKITGEPDGPPTPKAKLLRKT